EELTGYYQDFAVKHQKELSASIKNTNGTRAAYSPVHILSPERTDVREYKHSYTIRIRRLCVVPRSKEDKHYAILLVKEEGFDDVCGDIAFIPVGMQEKEEYKTLESGTLQGLFIAQHDMKNAGKTGTISGLQPDVYLMEADGGSSGTGWFSGSESGYRLYTLYTLPEPEWEINGTELRVKLPDADFFSDHRGLTDSFVISLRIGETQVLQEQMLFTVLQKKPDEPWKCDLDTLKLNGKKLTTEQKESLIMEIRECVTETYQSDPCLGPADPIALGGVLDIFGKWDIESKMNQLDHNYLDGILDAMPPGMKEAYEQALQSSNGQTTTGEMTVTKLDDGSILAEIRYSDPEAPVQSYDAVLDVKQRRLTLNPKQKLLTEPLILEISGSGSDLTFTCHMNYKSGIVDYDADLSGTKRPSEDQ
ncbi:MAG: hypothetical protein IKN55_10960, partial [Oscillospiraceae bacterium]|nr:hypothetical protein [Oscillospiraceae bacterium]